MPCPISNCRSTIETERLCYGHTRQLAAMLGDLWRFHKEAHQHLTPERTSEETRAKSSEPSLGVNVAALSWINSNDLYLILGGWERVIRGQRHLTPAGLLPPVPGVTTEVARLIAFHHNHLDWVSTQTFADAYFTEVKTLHGIGMAAARAYVEKQTRIHCPGELGDGLPCRALLTLDADDPLAAFDCRGCGTEWNSLRLVAVAQADRSKPLWVDVETAAHLLGKSVSQVYRTVAKITGKKRHRALVNLHQLFDYYAA